MHCNVPGRLNSQTIAVLVVVCPSGCDACPSSFVFHCPKFGFSRTKPILFDHMLCPSGLSLGVARVCLLLLSWGVGVCVSLQIKPALSIAQSKMNAILDECLNGIWNSSDAK